MTPGAAGPRSAARSPALRPLSLSPRMAPSDLIVAVSRDAQRTELAVLGESDAEVIPANYVALDVPALGGAASAPDLDSNGAGLIPGGK